jgi:hypothetical protein
VQVGKPISEDVAALRLRLEEAIEEELDMVRHTSLLKRLLIGYLVKFIAFCLETHQQTSVGD